MKEPRKQYNPTCAITGKKDNLLMYPNRDDNGNMVGWFFLHESIDVSTINHKTEWLEYHHPTPTDDKELEELAREFVKVLLPQPPKQK